MTQFSIIIPVYNAEAYLDECLDSVKFQTYADYEVVCVNDGSTDASQQILEARAFADARIRLVNKANGGPSSARNDGIRVAQGDYLCFLDADDQLIPNALERIAAAVEEAPCDAVVFAWSFFPRARADRFVREHARLRDAWYPQFDPDLLFKEMSNPYLRLAVRREALASSGVMFDESLNVGEDALFLFSLYPRIAGVRLVSDELYRYRLPHEGSIMADYKYDVAHLAVCDLDAAIAIFANWKQGGLIERYGAQLMKWFVHGQLYTILRQPQELREPLTAVVRQMWRVNYTTAQLVSLDVNEPTARLIRLVLAANDEGRLVVDERELARALWRWRIAEYGVADLAVTAGEHAVASLLENREMLKRQSLGSDDGRSLESADEQGAEGVGGAAAARERQRAPLVSVVVPVYNVAAFLDQALDSIQAQTLEEIEIICVNDGSTDASPEIMREHAARDARIRVVDKPNGGYGSACNRGIAEARGYWVAIMEPDDWIDPAMYQAMVDYAASFAQTIDIVKTPYWRIWMPDTPQQRRINCSYRGRIKPATQPFQLTDPGVTHLIIHHPSIWSALYRRDFLSENSISFKEIPGAGWADNPFLAETLCQAKAIVYLDEPFYSYREEAPEKTASVARNGWKVSLDRWHDMLDVYERLGVADENIRRAHVRRGFTYVGLILEYHDLDQEPDVRDEVLRVFARMDDALVFSESNISPGSKELFSKMTGRALPKVSPVPYLVQVLKGGAYNVVNTGPAMTLDTLRSFVSAHARREGK